MMRPPAAIAVFFCAGIACAKFIPEGFGFLFLLAAIVFLAGIVLIQKRNAFAVITLLLALLSGILAFKNSLTLPRCHILNLLSFKKSEFYIVKGQIESLPQIKPDKSSFFFGARQIHSGNNHYRCSGKVLVEVRGRKDFYYGQSLLLKGSISPLPSFRSQAKYYRYLENQGVLCMMRVDSPAMASGAGEKSDFSLKRLAFWLKQKMEEIINRHLPVIPAGILEAMILGEKKHIPKAIYDGMVRTGTVHILPRLYTKMPSVAL